MVFAIGLGLTSGSLALLGAVHTTPPAGSSWPSWSSPTWSPPGVRFLLMRIWVFRAARATA